MNDIWPADMRDYAALWRYEHATWLSDISCWQAEHQAIMVDWDRLQEHLQDKGFDLRNHADTIAAHGRILADHVRRISECHSQGEGYDEIVSHHEELAGEHAEQRGAHERLKGHHHTMIVQLSMLVKEF